MAKLRFDPTTGNSEWEGTPDELLAIYAGLKHRFGSVPQNANALPRPRESPRMQITFKNRYVDLTELAKSMPTVEQLVNYVLSKPKFEHDIVGVGKDFFKMQIKSRQYGRLYRELKTKLELARKAIEVSHRGAFERRPAPNRNLQVYTFKQVNATPISTALDRTS